MADETLAPYVLRNATTAAAGDAIKGGATDKPQAGYAVVEIQP